MNNESRTFHISQRTLRSFTWADFIAFALVVILIYLGISLATHSPQTIAGPDISLDFKQLPRYTLLSVARMAGAYLLSLIFTLVYGRWAAYNKRAERVLMPLLDVLQSVPILSFLPVVLLSLSSILPSAVAAELASVILIFTSQAWNMTFAWYQSVTTIPKELKEASAIYHLNSWMKFKQLELPFGMISLIWNSMMSWAGGWFFLMAAESFTVGSRDFRLPGLGSFLHEAASQNNTRAIIWGIAALVITVILLDQFIWRPLIAWSDRFKVEMTSSDNTPSSWFYDLMQKAGVMKKALRRTFQPLAEGFDRFQIKRFPMATSQVQERPLGKWLRRVLILVVLAGVGYGIFRAVMLLIQVPVKDWSLIGLSVGATFLRVFISLILALLWTIPVGVAIGTNRRVASILQPIVQVIASVPATALFPVLLLFIVNLKGGISLAAVILMLMGTQWYLLFNIIAGASAIPQDLKYTSELMNLRGFERWRTLILPAIFPYLVTGLITASGGAWNASIVAEYQNFGSQVLSTTGIGALIAQATAGGDYPLLLAATIAMILTVILINRLLWRQMYRAAEEKYRME